MDTILTSYKNSMDIAKDFDKIRNSEEMSNGFKRVKNHNNKWDIFNEKNEKINKREYDYVISSFFNKKFILCEIEQKTGLIDLEGNELTELIYFDFFLTTSGIIWVEKYDESYCPLDSKTFKEIGPGIFVGDEPMTTADQEEYILNNIF